MSNCWLKLELSSEAPKNWPRKRIGIHERIMDLTRCPKKEATIQEINPDDTLENKAVFERSDDDHPKVGNLNRIKIDIRQNEISEVLKYNILRREDNQGLQNWKSYPGISNIVEIARQITEKGDTSSIGNLAEMMQVHESQQSAAVIATIAVLVGSRLDDGTDKLFREAIGNYVGYISD